MKDLNKKEVQKILDKNNGNIKQTALDINKDFKKLLNYCWRHNLNYKLEKPRIDLIEAQQLYNELQSLRKVAKILNCSAEGLRLAMHQKNMTVNELVIHTVDDNFFAEDNEQSMYWAGFMAADGCIPDFKNRDNNTLTCGLARIDKHHLQKFADTIKWSGQIYDGQSKKDGKIYLKSEIGITSDKIIKDLTERFGFGHRKSLVYEFPERLVNHPLVHHFIRGYFDGDGSFYIQDKNSKKPTKQMCFSLIATKPFLETFRSILDHEIPDISTLDKKLKKQKNMWVLEYGGNAVVCKLRDYMYKDATVFLERKDDLVRDLTTVERFDISADDILDAIKKLKTQRKVAEYFECSEASIVRFIEKYNISQEVEKYRIQKVIRIPIKDIAEKYKELKSSSLIAEFFNFSWTTAKRKIDQAKKLGLL